MEVEEIQVLDKTLGERLLAFLLDAKSEVFDYSSPPDFLYHVFVAGEKVLVVNIVSSEKGLEGILSAYLFKVYHALQEFAAIHSNEEDLDEGVTSIALPIREDLVRRLQMGFFWQ